MAHTKSTKTYSWITALFSIAGYLTLSPSCHALKVEMELNKSGVRTGGSGRHFEPQVAMACASRSQYHAQHMTETGKWITDTNSKVTCLKDKVDILHFCKQVYPNRDITNIVESSHYYKVPNFCRVGHSKCKASAWVKPFRCLEGSFQSDALLVPEGCLFDHIHNQSRCWEFDNWNTTADHACQARHMTLKSFAMLLPCGIDVFSGVEFVCCPKNYKGPSKSYKADSKNYKGRGSSQSMEVEEPRALPELDHRLVKDSQSSSTAAPKEATTTTISQEINTRDEYFSRFDPHEEHDAFRRAEQRLEEKHREKVSKIMKEWSDLEERYQELHASDPRGAEEFKQRMTQRFQQTVEAVETENEAEKHQLTALHQQRIVAHINEMKREAMTCYTRALAEKQINTHGVQKCLQKLLRSLNKDRHHTVSHYKHLLYSDYEAADRERDATLQHLNDLERMVDQSLTMLARHPDLNAKIGRLMREYAAALRSKDTTPPELSTRPPKMHPKDLTANELVLGKDNMDKDIMDDEDDSLNNHSQELDDDHNDKNDDDYDNDEDDNEEDEDVEDYEDEDDIDDDDELPENDDLEDLPESSSMAHANQEEDIQEVDSSMSPTSGSSIRLESEAVDSSAFEASSSPASASEPVLMHNHHDTVQVAHAQKHDLSISPSGYSVTRENSGRGSRGVYFTLAFAGVALMIAMVVGIVVQRRRNSTTPQNQGFMEVDQNITPEEKHVANMQSRGYENPTYKYFEEK